MGRNGGGWGAPDRALQDGGRDLAGARPERAGELLPPPRRWTPRSRKAGGASPCARRKTLRAGSLRAASRCGNYPLRGSTAAPRDPVRWAELAYETHPECPGAPSPSAGYASSTGGRSEHGRSDCREPRGDTLKLHMERGLPVEVNEATTGASARRTTCGRRRDGLPGGLQRAPASGVPPLHRPVTCSTFRTGNPYASDGSGEDARQDRAD